MTSQEERFGDADLRARASNHAALAAHDAGAHPSGLTHQQVTDVICSFIYEEKKYAEEQKRLQEEEAKQVRFWRFDWSTPSTDSTSWGRGTTAQADQHVANMLMNRGYLITKKPVSYWPQHITPQDLSFTKKESILIDGPV